MERKELTQIEIIVHGSPEMEAEYRALAAKIHAQYILYYLNRLSCPIEQKRELFDAVVDTMRKKADGQKK